MSRVIAFYLPQYHPIKQNNEWWGEGFTEWSNVVKAKPRFSGHRQPQLPSDLGYYDLRVKETRASQAELAKRYGIDGFCYYHYWFNGEKLLERPLEEMLEISQPDFPFCICWANENWTRAWDGMEREVLIKQDYTQDDSVEHFNYLSAFFADPRYIKVDDKPLFLLYRLDNIPNVAEYISRWRELAIAHGFKGLHISAVKNGFVTMPDKDILAIGFDSIVDFQPNRADFPTMKKTTSQHCVDLARKILPTSFFQLLKGSLSAVNKIDYKQLVAEKTQKIWPTTYVKYPVVFPSWDNTARRKTPTVIQNDQPDLYQEWLNYSLNSVSSYDEHQQLVFINAWNEWAEGCHLEPDNVMGHKFLESTLSAVNRKV
ncbi:glycosyltransferase WbsX family protein [Serratia fonticola]|uniref:glycosyltransferase WbsX family protein n=1 Tax=Serratia fonticola TaxID=47917 RepID=UPI0024DE0A85|nr:glycoside hydrolase family 99-like domain-containing protein [Serratia fonticola]MDK2375912.1 glycoside hydrolase family 99-like domain-containing protein [Serratia fonticola]